MALATAIQAAVLMIGVRMTTDALCKFAIAVLINQAGAAFICGWWIYICRVREGLTPVAWPKVQAVFQSCVTVQCASSSDTSTYMVIWEHPEQF